VLFLRWLAIFCFQLPLCFCPWPVWVFYRLEHWAFSQASLLFNKREKL
jgi:hypothetical protein